MKRMTRQSLRRLTLFGTALGVVVAAQLSGVAADSAGAASSGQVTTDVAYNPKGIIRDAYDLSQGQVPFDPATIQNTDSGSFIGQLLDDSLLRTQPDGSLTPALATAATIVDPATISVTLRPNVHFQDGTPLNAAAVQFTIERNLATKNPAFPAELADVSSIDLNGDLGLTIHLTGPDAGAFYPVLASVATMPVSPAAVGRRDADPVANPLGAGPFQVKQYVPGQSLLLIKSPSYWDAKSIKLGGIQFVQTALGTPAGINELKAGTIDVLTSDPSQLGALKGPGIAISSVSSPTAKLWFPLCDSAAPLDNLKVRQALNYALDKPLINQALTGGKGQPSWSIVPPTSNLYDPSLTNYYAYNEAKAKQLLAQAGYSHGLTLTMIPTPAAVTNSLALIAQEEWKKIGVNLEIKSSANYVQDVFTNHIVQLTDADVVKGGLGALSFIYTPGHLGDLCNYQNPTLTAMITQLGALAPTDPRYLKLWQQAQSFVVKNALSVFGVWLPTVIASNSARVGNIQTVIPDVTGYPDFFTAYVKK